MMNMERQILARLRKNNRRLVGPDQDPEAWQAFVARVNDLLGEDHKAKNAEHRIQRVLIAAYGEVLYDAVSDFSHPQRQESAYLELNDWIYRRIAYRIGETEDAKDLTQEILELVHKKLDKVTKPRVFPAFVSTIIWNKLREYYRKKKRENERVQSMDREDSEDVEIDFPDESVSDALAALMVEEAEMELIAKLNECMPARARKQTEVLVLAAFSPFTPSQIAKLLKIKTGNVYTLLSRARENFLQHCRDLLENIANFLDPTIRNQTLGGNC